jgi:hypothetical protein
LSNVCISCHCMPNRWTCHRTRHLRSCHLHMTDVLQALRRRCCAQTPPLPLWCVAACHNSKLARIIANKLFQGLSAVNHQLVWVGGVRVCAGSEGGEEAIDCCFQTSFFHTLHSVLGAAQPGLCLPGHDDRWNTAYMVSLPSPRTEKTQMQSPTL